MPDKPNPKNDKPQPPDHGTEDNRTPFERFQDLTKRVVRVPKDKADSRDSPR